MNIAVQKLQWNVNVAIGYVGFTVRKHDAVAAGIRWFESGWNKVGWGVKPSHTFLISDSDETIEAFGNGIHRGTLTAYLHDPDVALLVRRPFGWTAEMGRNIVEAGSMHLGHKYGYWLIAGMAVSRSFLGMALNWATRGWFGRRVQGWCDGKQAEICSELVSLAMQGQGGLVRRGVLQQAANTITPVDLFRDSFAFEPCDYAIELVD
jgi:hypothetical protein